MLHSDPTTVRMIYQQMIEDEMARNRIPDPDDIRYERPSARLGSALRRGTARALHTLARRLDPGIPVEILPTSRQAT